MVVMSPIHSFWSYFVSICALRDLCIKSDKYSTVYCCNRVLGRLQSITYVLEDIRNEEKGDICADL